METEEKTYTSKQLEVINADTGYNMVLAGPGCGDYSGINVPLVTV